MALCLHAYQTVHTYVVINHDMYILIYVDPLHLIMYTVYMYLIKSLLDQPMEILVVIHRQIIDIFFITFYFPSCLTVIEGSSG